MSGSDRKRMSKWDLKEQAQSQSQWNKDGSYSKSRSHSRSPISRRGRSPRSRSRSRSRSPSRGFKRELGVDENNRDQRQFPHRNNQNFEDRNYPRGGASPNRNWSRSQSRSPSRGFKRESDVYDRSRNKDQSRFSNRNNQNYEDKNYPRDNSPNGYENRHTMEQRPFRAEICNNFLKGRCERGTSCRFSHQLNETIREKEDDRRNKGGSSFEHGGWREPLPPRRVGGDIPCKFFASGNCRSGENCRFTHYSREFQSTSSDRLFKDQKLEFSDPSRDLKRNNSGFVADGGNSNSEDYKKHGFPESRVNPWSKNDAWDNNFENKKILGGPRDFAEVAGPEEQVSFNSKNVKKGSTGTDINTGVGDMEMSHEWNYNGKSPNHMKKENVGYVDQISQTLTNPNEVSLPASNGIQHNASFVHPNMFENTYLQQYPIGNNTSGSQIDLNTTIGNLPGQTLYQNNAVTLENLQTGTVDPNHREHVNNLQNQPTPSDIPPMQQNAVSNVQLAQLSNISASLAQLFGNEQQIPQLYAALNPQNTLPHSNEAGPPVMPQIQYDQVKSENTILPPLLPPNPIGQNIISEGKTEIPSKNNTPSPIANGQRTPREDGKVNIDAGGDEMKKTQKKSPETKMEDEEGGAEKEKKSKDAKVSKAFKFALVEFVKELLKPSWKENQINKDAYKTIVKKVTDKVTGTLQGAHIPQTQEKIDQYLSISKPKLTKLVQAYVEKHQKS